MIVKTQAIVLHALKYGENGRVLKSMTAEEGLIPLFVRSIGNPRKGGINAYLEPMTRVELCYERKGGQGMANLKEIHPVSTAELISTDVYTSSIAIFMAEVAKGIVHEGEKDMPLFELLWNWVERLHASERLADLPILYLISLSHMMGFSPDQESKGAYFDLREGLFTSSRPLHQEYLNQEIAIYLRSYLAFDTEPDSQISTVPGTIRTLLLENLLHYFKIHIHGFKEIQSHKILAKSFS